MEALLQSKLLSESNRMKKRTRFSRLVAILLALALSAPAVVLAGPEEAAEFYRQASEAYQAGDLRKAADLLERAYAEDPNLIYQYNRILALQGLGEYEKALRVLELYESPMKDDPDGRFDDVAEIKSKLQESIERKKRLAEEKRREKEKEKETEKEKDEETDDEKDELADKDETKKDVQPPPKVDAGPNYLAWGLMGTGAAFVGTGALFASGVLISDEIDRAEQASAELQDEEFDDFIDVYGEDLTYIEARDMYDSDKDTVSTHQLLSGVFLGTGAALVVTGGVIWMLDSPESDPAGAQQADRLRIAPAIVRDGFGARLRYDF